MKTDKGAPKAFPSEGKVARRSRDGRGGRPKVSEAAAIDKEPVPLSNRAPLGSLGDTRRAGKAGAVGEADCDGGVAA